MRNRRLLAGIVAIALTWAGLWGLAGAGVSLLAGLLDPAVIEPGEGPVELAGIVGVAGLAAGLLFGILHAAAVPARDLADLALPTAALLGLLAGAALPLLSLVTAHPSNTIALGGAAALATVLLARAMRPAATRPA
jgi:hypothetical protein